MQRFADLSIGTKFIYDNKECVKIKDERITCCKLFNAMPPNDPGQKFFIPPISEVEVIN